MEGQWLCCLALHLGGARENDFLASSSRPFQHCCTHMYRFPVRLARRCVDRQLLFPGVACQLSVHRSNVPIRLSHPTWIVSRPNARDIHLRSIPFSSSKLWLVFHISSTLSSCSSATSNWSWSVGRTLCSLWIPSFPPRTFPTSQVSFQISSPVVPICMSIARSA